MKASIQIITLLLAGCLFASSAFADDISEVSALMNQKVKSIVVLLQDKSLSKSDRDRQILTIVEPVFDFSKMAKLSLGRRHWPSMDKSQQKEFSKHFTKRLQESYLEKMGLYTDETIVHKETTQKKKKIKYTSVLVSKDDTIDMEYRLYKSSQGWKVYDVVIMGVSVVQTYRSQFDSLLQKDSSAQDKTKYDNLIGKLRDPSSLKKP